MLALLLLLPEAAVLEELPEAAPALDDEVSVLTPSVCSSAAKSACRVCRALCRDGGALPLEVAPVVVTPLVVVPLVDDEAAGAIAGLVLLLAGVLLAALLVEDADGRPWASWLNPEVMLLAGLVEVAVALVEVVLALVGVVLVAEDALLPVELDGGASAACCSTIESASNSAERKCVSA